MNSNALKQDNQIGNGLHGTNEFDQPIKGVSLYRDAWRRLKKNKMAIAGLIVVLIYSLLSLLAPILPIYSYKDQFMDHIHLPPSLTLNAEEQMMNRKMVELSVLSAKE